MGIFNKLKFWKKDDDFDFDDLAQKEIGSDLPPQDDLGLGAENEQRRLGLDEKSPFPETPTEQPSFETQQPSMERQPRQQQPQLTTGNRDLELISSKLDTIKALLNSMDQRVANLEKAAGIEKKQQERLW